MRCVAIAATLLSFAFAGSAAAQQVIHVAPVTGAVVGGVPPYGVPCGGFYPYNPTYAYPVAPWCPAMTRSTYPATTTREVVYSRPKTKRLVYVRPKQTVVRRAAYRTASAHPSRMGMQQ